MDYLAERLLCALLSGILLCQAGSFIQLGTRNILASPSTLGLDGLSILWLVGLHSLALSWGGLTPLQSILLGTPFFVLIGLSFVQVLHKKADMDRVILLGLTFNLMVGAVFSLWQFFFLAFNLPFPMEVWFGHFRYAETSALSILLLAEGLILIGFFSMRKTFLLFSLGPELAENFGLRRKGLFGFLFVGAVLATFVVVGLFGAFAFLGLIGPLLARKLFFARWDLDGEILLGSFCFGGVFMAIDLLCYLNPIFGAEVPVGLFMTAVGAVSLILLVWISKGGSQLLAKPRK